MAQKRRWMVGTVIATLLALGLVAPASATPVVLYQSDQVKATGELTWLGMNYQIYYSIMNVTLDLLQIECTWTGTLGSGQTFTQHMSYPIPGDRAGT